MLSQKQLYAGRELSIMKKQYMFLLPLLTLMMAWSACDDYVTSIDPLIDQVEDEQLNNESEVPFIIVGLETQFGETHDELMMIADLLSDQLYFTRKIKGASYSTYEKIDLGNIEIDNSSSGGPEIEVGRLRLYGDDLVERVDKIDFSDPTLRSTALFKGYLYGGAARYYYATYFGLTEDQGGGVIDGGEFIPSNDMYDLAIEKFKDALANTEDAATKRMVNSLIARCYLFKADYTNARTYAQAGMISGDAPYQALHNAEDDPNYYWSQAGVGRRQAACDDRFNDYITADSTEENRVLIVEAINSSRTDKNIYWGQDKYPLPETGVNLINWQENELMRAELDLRAGDAAGCLTKINNVRASYGVSLLTSADMSVLIEERDKELFVTGLRLVDQRRFAGEWHLDTDKWKYLPLSDSERNANENLD